jgi:hypothetical protein
MEVIVSKYVNRLQKYMVKMIVQSLPVGCCKVGLRVSANGKLYELWQIAWLFPVKPLLYLSGLQTIMEKSTANVCNQSFTTRIIE